MHDAEQWYYICYRQCWKVHKMYCSSPWEQPGPTDQLTCPSALPLKIGLSSNFLRQKSDNCPSCFVGPLQTKDIGWIFIVMFKIKTHISNISSKIRNHWQVIEKKCSFKNILCDSFRTFLYCSSVSLLWPSWCAQTITVTICQAALSPKPIYSAVKLQQLHSKKKRQWQQDSVGANIYMVQSIGSVGGCGWAGC